MTRMDRGRSWRIGLAQEQVMELLAFEMGGEDSMQTGERIDRATAGDLGSG